MLDKITKLIKDIIIPKKCYSCKKEWYFLCNKCVKNVDSFNSICYICKKSSKWFKVHESCKKGIHFDNLIILYHYRNNIIKKLIKDAKFYNKKDIFEDFAFYLSNKLIENINIKDKEEYLLIPVPLHFLRKLKRWYNQAEIISSNILDNVWLKFNKKILYKKKNTRQQSWTSKQSRLSNLKNSFKINKKQVDKIDNIKTKTIILIDDVVSTWATLNEISKILKQTWFTKVICLVIASD